MATLFFDVSFESEVTEDSHAGGKKRRHQEIGTMAADAKKRRLWTSDCESGKYDLTDDAVSGMAESEYDILSESLCSQSGEGIGGYAATCCSPYMPYTPEFEKSPISYESDAESCGSNSPEPEQERGFDVCDFAEQLLMFKDDEDGGDWEQYLSPDMDFLLEGISFSET